jgi:preprotein translocase subunit YajC
VKPDVILLVIPVVLIVLLTVQNRRRRQALAATQNQLLLGAKVMTGAGMFGTVVAIEGNEVTLETGPGQTSRWLRQAVVRVITQGPGPTAHQADEPDQTVHGSGSAEEHSVKD